MGSKTMSSVGDGALVTLSVVSHGDASALQALLKSLAAHEQANRIQLIVTDNLGSNLPDFASSGWHSFKTLRNARPQGYARNHNAAFEQTEGTYFCVCNPDVVFVEPVLFELTKLLMRGTADIVAPMIVDSGGRVQDSFRKLPAPLELIWRRTLGPGHALPIPLSEIVRPDWLAGIFLLMRRETFANVGRFDAGYHLYFEDVDFCARARLMGLTPAMTTRLRLLHDAQRASGHAGLYLLWHLQSAFRFFGSDVYRRARRLRNSNSMA